MKYVVSILTMAVFFASGCATVSAVTKPAAPVVVGLHPVIDKPTEVDKIVIAKVIEGLPMAKAGVMVGDEIVSVDGHKFKVAEALLAYTTKRTEATEFKFLRDGKEIIVKIIPSSEERKFGFDVNFFDSKKGQVFPTYLIKGRNDLTWSPDSGYDYHADAISKAQISSYVNCGMMISAPLLNVLIDVGNKNEEALDYNSEVSIYVIANGGQLLKPLSDYETDQLLKVTNNSTTAYLNQISNIAEKYRTMWQGKAGVDKDQDLVPTDTHKRVNLKYDARGLTPPFNVRAEIRKEKYEFKFDTTERQVDFGT